MHETKHPLVKGYIDNFKRNNDEIIFDGWCFHEKYYICETRLKYLSSDSEEIILYNLNTNKIRQDVSNYYNNPDILNCGWNFMFQKKDKNPIKDLEIQMFFDDDWNNILIFQPPLNTNNFVIRPRNYIPSFVVVDNFYENPDQIRSFALTQDFSFHPDYHKGKRTNKTFLFEGLKESFENILGCKITNWEKYGVNGCFQSCIAGDQLVYHFDTQTYAGIIYLTPDAPPQSGTAFYRSKHTKKMKVDNSDFSIAFKNGFLDSTAFDVVDVVGNVYNRVVLFDAQMIHAACTYFGTNLENGRLFQLFFFDLDI
jgi:hypothetical protein